MSSRWFRFYAEAMRNPKVAKLSDKDFRLWVQLLAVASENDGKIPPVDDLKVVLNRRLDHLLTGVKELLRASLIDPLEDGYTPHNWNKFQYKSDTSTERVTLHRKKRNVSETAPETEAETELPLPRGNGAKPDSDKNFWASAKSYLGPSKASLIGKWSRDYGQSQTAAAITEAQVNRAVDPIPYIERVLRQGQRETSGSAHIPEGMPC